VSIATSGFMQTSVDIQSSSSVVQTVH